MKNVTITSEKHPLKQVVLVKDKALEIFRKVDHAAIYVLIAGTYTPFCVNAFEGFWKWGMLSIIWSLAIIGIVVLQPQKVCYTGIDIAMDNHRIACLAFCKA